MRTGLDALTNLEHRGATGAEADTGDGAGILVQVPDRFLRGVLADDGIELPPAGALRRRHGVPAGRRRRRREGPGGDRDHRRRGGPRRRRAGATCRSTRAASASPPGPRCRRSAARRQPTRPAPPGIDLDRKVYVVRKRIEHELDAELATYFPSLSSRTLVYKGMFTTPQLVGVLPRPQRRALRERPAARPQPLLDQHLPVVAARPPVPLRRPQRRDQHGAGQRELDARPRGDARQPAPARPRAGVPDLHARRVRHRPLRRGARAAPPRRPAAAPRRADDDPAGVGEQRRRWTRRSGRSTASTPR